jgi:hypothetical protein
VVAGQGSSDQHRYGGVDEDDAAIRAERDDRVVVRAAGFGIVGQSTKSDNPKQIVGVISLPVSVCPNVYAKESENVGSAIENRITKKQRPFTANKEDRILVGRLVSAAIGNHERKSVFSVKRVIGWWENRLIADMRSGKWSEARLENTIYQLCQRVDPTFKLSADVKLEPMPEGKAPRMLIADGDQGQVMALMTVCCIEDLIKKHFPKKTIKGLGKQAAIKQVANELRVPKCAFKKCKQGTSQTPGASVFEGDGSAWDTTCSAEWRDLAENPVIKHVGSVLKVLMSEPISWVDAHEDICKVKQLALTFKKKGEFATYLIDAIRRSGHRGTSCLNWWCNFVGWHAALFPQPEDFLDPDVRYGEDHAGTLRWVASAFEGDDSILSTTPAIDPKSEIYISLLQRWERYGFNMKIFIREDRALFTGYYMALDNSGPTGVIMPDIERCFTRSGVSCSTSMIEFFNAGDPDGCKAVSKAAALARAHEFAGLCPTISTKFLRYYEDFELRTHVDRDLVMRTCGRETDFNEPEIVSEINMRNGEAMTFDTSELERLAAVGFRCTQDELETFCARLWDYGMLCDWQGFRESLPESWRSQD